MNTIVLPERMMRFLETQATRHGFADPSAYLQSIIQDLQEQQPSSVDDALRQALREPSFVMTQEHWTQLRNDILQRSPELNAE